MFRTRLGVAAAMAVAFGAGCGAPSDRLAQGLPVPVRVAAQDGITQSTPLETEIPDAGPGGGSLAGTVAIPGKADATTMALASGTPDRAGGGIVRLETPEGFNYMRLGQPMTAPIDGRGRFTFGSTLLPAGLPVQEAAFLGGRYVLLNFSTIRPGTNSVSVTAASTYAGEYLIHEASLRGRSPTSFDPAKWQSLIELTQAALDDGRLQADLEDFGQGMTGALLIRYGQTLEDDPDLFSAWQSLLGPTPLPTPRPSYKPPVGAYQAPGV